MNKAQKTVVAAALVLIVLMGMFPPWQDVRLSMDVGYAPLWWWGPKVGPISINVSLLTTQWLGVVLVAVACCCLATKPKPNA